MNKYEAADALFKGGTVKLRASEVNLGTVDLWCTEFKHWERDGYSEVKTVGRDEAIEALLRGKTVKHSGDVLKIKDGKLITSPTSWWAKEGWEIVS